MAMVYLDGLLRERLHLSVILGELTDTVVVHHEILALRDRQAFACERERCVAEEMARCAEACIRAVF